MAFIYFLSSRSSLPSPFEVNLPFIDKLFHFIEYLILGVLLSLNGFSKVILFLVGIIYGGLDELHQGFVKGRDPSFFDWVFDCLGVFIGLYGVFLWKKKRSL